VLAAADRVLVLRDGMVEHEGPVDSVMPRPTAIAGGAA
jgi:ABC-type sulfate/molybdate transport systems ATPase subunit